MNFPIVFTVDTLEPSVILATDEGDAEHLVGWLVGQGRAASVRRFEQDSEEGVYVLSKASTMEAAAFDHNPRVNYRDTKAGRAYLEARGALHSFLTGGARV